MKKRILLIFLLIFVVIVNITHDNSYAHDNKLVKYALTIDGVKQKEFPQKGLYSVSVDCINGNGKWDYDNWKLYLDNINDDVHCNIAFSTREKEVFNEYLIRLTNTNQGNGKMIHEIINDPIDNDYTILNQSQYNILNSYYYNGNTSGTPDRWTHYDVNGIFAYNENAWNNDLNNMVVKNNSRTYYNFEFGIVDTGYYYFCYNNENVSSSNTMDLFLNENYLGALIYGNTGSKCIQLGELTNSDIVRFSQSSYDSFSNISFYLKRINSFNAIDTGYRYEGKNPNNYVWFNNELWRIIGVMNGATTGYNDLNLVKLLREEPLNQVQVSRPNQYQTLWKDVSINKLLNDTYFNARNSNTNCSAFYDNGSLIDFSCDYSRIGLKLPYQKMVKTSTWFLGAFSNNDRPTIEQVYNMERNNAIESQLKIEAKIGLMYASDYAFSALAESCKRNTAIGGYSVPGCIDENWVFKGDEWLITPNCNGKCSGTNSYGYHTLLFGGGGVGGAFSGENHFIRPVLYLNEKVYVYAGDGSITDPYIIGMDEA